MVSIRSNLGGGGVHVCIGEGFVNFANVWCLDKPENSVKGTVIVFVIHEFRPKSYVRSLSLARVGVFACPFVVVCNIGCGQHVGEME